MQRQSSTYLHRDKGRDVVLDYLLQPRLALLVGGALLVVHVRVRAHQHAARDTPEREVAKGVELIEVICGTRQRSAQHTALSLASARWQARGCTQDCVLAARGARLAKGLLRRGQGRGTKGWCIRGRSTDTLLPRVTAGGSPVRPR